MSGVKNKWPACPRLCLRRSARGCISCCYHNAMDLHCACNVASRAAQGKNTEEKFLDFSLLILIYKLSLSSLMAVQYLASCELCIIVELWLCSPPKTSESPRLRNAQGYTWVKRTEQRRRCPCFFSFKYLIGLHRIPGGTYVSKHWCRNMAACMLLKFCSHPSKSLKGSVGVYKCVSGNA